MALENEEDVLAPKSLDRASLARVSASGEVSDRLELPLPEDPHGPLGDAQRVVCPAEHDCWAATADGWLLHLATEGERRAPNVLSDPVFAHIEAGEPIAFRPADAGVPQETPDEVPENNSGESVFTRSEELVKPPRAELARVPVPLVTHLRTRVLHRTELVLSFHLAVKAKVRLKALRRGKVVAQTAMRTLGAGNRQLALRLEPASAGHSTSNSRRTRSRRCPRRRPRRRTSARSRPRSSPPRDCSPRDWAVDPLAPPADPPPRVDPRLRRAARGGRRVAEPARSRRAARRRAVRRARTRGADRRLARRSDASRCSAPRRKRKPARSGGSRRPPKAGARSTTRRTRAGRSSEPLQNSAGEPLKGFALDTPGNLPRADPQSAGRRRSRPAGAGAMLGTTGSGATLEQLRAGTRPGRRIQRSARCPKAEKGWRRASRCSV